MLCLANLLRFKGRKERQRLKKIDKDWKKRLMKIEF
jgi:hypothetical protein